MMAIQLCSTGKRAYGDRASADEALKEIWKHPRPGKVPTQAYQCGVCQFWHLTSAHRPKDPAQ